MFYTPIAPVGLFDVIEDFDNAFVLAHLWAHEKYRRFYANRSWDIVILDNGVYEGADVKWETIHEIAQEIEADRLFVVAPEVMFKAQETVEVVKDYIRRFRPKNYEVMAVLQAEIPSMVKVVVEQLVDVVDAFAVPIWMYRRGWCRAGILSWIFSEVDEASARYWHALGLDTLLELPELSGLVDSVDTSMPFTAAAHGMDLQVNLIVKGKRRVNLLRESFPDHVRQLARKNVETLLRWLR